MNKDWINNLAWEKMGGLIPAFVQDSETLQALMLGYMNREALEQTLDTGNVTFFSRSKKRLWMKGEISGNVLSLVEARPDCDNDALLIMAHPKGPTCHEGTTSCFGEMRIPKLLFLNELARLINERYERRPEGSYTTKLFKGGIDRIAQKVGEEAIELVIAAKNEDEKRLKEETADLLFHMLVLFQEKGIPFADAIEVLRERRTKVK